MIFAKLDVRFPFHDRFTRLVAKHGMAGAAAVGLWCAALAWVRGEGRPGTLPKHQAGVLLGLGLVPMGQVGQPGQPLQEYLSGLLLEVGLFLDKGTEYELRNYADKNETEEDIEARRDHDRERKRRQRARLRAPVTGDGTAPVTARDMSRDHSPGFPGSDSGSYSSDLDLIPDQKIVTVTPREEGAEPESLEAKARALTAAVAVLAPPSQPEEPARMSRPVDLFQGHDDASAWADGVAKVTGGTLATPTGGELRILTAAIHAAFPPASAQGLERAAKIRADAQRFARDLGDLQPNVFRYRDWLGGGRKPFGRPTGAKANHAEPAYVAKHKGTSVTSWKDIPPAPGAPPAGERKAGAA